jgi:hypothetical protein
MVDEPDTSASDRNSPEQEQIRERARLLWLQAGTPSGRDEEFWHQAEAEIKAERIQSA